MCDHFVRSNNSVFGNTRTKMLLKVSKYLHYFSDFCNNSKHKIISLLPIITIKTN